MKNSAVVVTAAMLVGIATGVAGFPGPMGAAGAESFTCRGLPATIVGSPGANVRGTPEADVIVTNGAQRVLADAGDDVICTTNTPPEEQHQQRVLGIFAMSGNDVIDRSGDPDPGAISYTNPGDGEDTYLGGPAKDRVYSTDSGADTIDTGAGNDFVRTGDPLYESGATGADVVDLGDGADIFALHQAHDNVSPGLTFTGGAGHDRFIFATRGGHWNLDAAHGEATHNQAHAFSFAEMETYSLDSRGPTISAFHFVGTGGSESVAVSPASAADGANLRGGDDVIRLYGYDKTTPPDNSVPSAPLAGHPFVGGPGTDRMEVWSRWDDVRLSLADQRLDFRFDNAGTPDDDLLGFEDASVASDRARLTGDAGPNTLTWHACHGAVRAGNGDDTVSWLGDAPHRCESSDRMHAYGNGGDDYLRGGKYDDVLIGGPGQDTANGQSGYDACRAEVTVKCEPS